MAITDKLVMVVLISSMVTARTIRNTQEIQLEPRVYPVFTQDDTYAAASTIQELPRIPHAAVPFNVPEPSGELRPPQANSPVTFLELAAPATDLTAPSETLWNPENNPVFFYELPASLTKLDTPTNKFPKKYNKDIHSKDKALSSQPKIEIELVPIEERELVYKQKDLDKKFDQLAKLENQKDLENLKALSNHKDDSLQAATGYTDYNEDDEDAVQSASEDGYSRGLSQQLISAMGIPHHDSTRDRLTFHVVGHDGPHTYKWGYDTGKGSQRHNRMFRFEEKDKSGIVKGHYGFYDKHGKLRVVNYDAHPHEGFHAESSTDHNDN
ncbi:uncharacterized protein LOC123310856 [Coccinella septempunctata]|uniref:uncharacterized protein LOC123310856 n=1 Tax=Coccinella septempunctata TaxID=41139 RepID=UPI001D0804A5|nr:uncharacterized protein LOC123310856 [Coccinella septempunctata]